MVLVTELPAPAAAPASATRIPEPEPVAPLPAPAIDSALTPAWDVASTETSPLVVLTLALSIQAMMWWPEPPPMSFTATLAPREPATEVPLARLNDSAKPPASARVLAASVAVRLTPEPAWMLRPVPVLSSKM